MKLNLLALETSGPSCSVALLRADGAQIEIFTREHTGRQEHAERLLPMADELLTQAGLDHSALQAVAFGQGPGGFTGLRVACGVAQGIALALGIPLIPVVSLLAVAADVHGHSHHALVIALDARMNEVYLAVYRPVAGGDVSTWQVLQAPFLIAASEVVSWIAHQLPHWSARAGQSLCVRLAGDAWPAYATTMIAPPGWQFTHAQRPTAGSVARLAWQAWQQGAWVAPENAAPLYVRDKVAYTSVERRQGLGGNPKAQGPPREVQLAPMTLADLEEVAWLEAQAQSSPWTRGNFADALAAGYRACVLRRDGRLVGFCVLMLAPDVAHLLTIAVARGEQRQGLGSYLLQWCEHQVRQQGLNAVLLEVRPSNRAAVRFYEHHGFMPIGVRRGYYPTVAGQGEREDAMMMQKTFSHEA